MKTWIRRVVSLALISLGIALVFFPYNNHQSGYVETEIVSLHIEENLNLDSIKEAYPGVKTYEIFGSDIYDDYPRLWEILNNLDPEWALSDTCEIELWKGLQDNVLKDNSGVNLILFNGVFCLVRKSENLAGKVIFDYLGEYNPNIRELTEKDLSRYPKILDVLTKIENKTIDFTTNSIPEKEWFRMVNKYLDPFNDSQRFKYNGRFYGPEFGYGIETKEAEFPHLSLILKIIGLVFFALGWLVIRKLYFRKRGIMVNPRRVAIFYDFITLLFAVPSAWLLAGVLLKKLMFIEPVFDEQEMTFMGVFFYCFGIPFMSLFTSRFTSQSVFIDTKGVLVDSLRRKDFIAWNAIETIEFSNEYIPVGRMGVAVPRHLQKSLKLTDKSGNTIIINEPQLKSVKRKIIEKLERIAPEPPKSELLQLLKNW